MQLGQTNITFEHYPAALLAFVPALINLVLFIYVFFRFNHDKLTQVFSLFLLSIIAWQVHELMTRVCISREGAIYYSNLINPFINFVPPLGLHFAIIFTRQKKIKRKLILPFLLYMPAFVFFALAYSHILKINIVSSSFWGWVVVYNNDLVGISNAAWMVLESFVMMALLFRYTFVKEYLNPTVKKQAKIIFIGLLIPVFIGAITEFIFPYILKIDAVPLISTTITAFSICMFIALSKYQLLSYSPKYAWQSLVENINAGIVIDD